MAECFGHRQRRGHQVAPELSFASASTSTGFSRGCASLSPRRPHGSPPIPCPTPPPRRGPERAASGPLPRPDSIRPASSSATLITRPRAAQDSVDVGRRQEEVICENTTGHILCRRLLLTEPAPASSTKPVQLPSPLWDGDGISPVEQLMALNRLQRSSPVPSSVPW